MSAALPLLSGFLGFFLCGLLFRWPLLQRWVSILASLLHLTVSGLFLAACGKGHIFSLQAGGWAAPFGITLYVDLTAALFLFVSAFLMLGVLIFSLSQYSEKEERYFHPLWHALCAGVFGAFSTGDLFNLFVWFELLLMSSFALTALGTKEIQWRATFYSVAMNLVGSSAFLLGLGFLYNSTGTLNHADLVLLRDSSGGKSIAAFLLFFAFALKSAAFPLYHWLPATYPGTPIGPLALFAGLLTKVGVYTLLRYFGTPSLITLGEGWIFPFLWFSALATMLLGVLGAASQLTMRRILSFHIISQIGYMLLALAIGSTLGIAALIFYVLHHMVVKTNLFLAAGAVESTQGSSQLKHTGAGLYTNPFLALAFAVSALSLAGIPPFSGFWAKVFVLGSAAKALDGWGVAVGLIVGLFTLFSMIKIWNEVFLKERPQGTKEGKRLSFAQGFALGIFTLWTIALGVYPKPILELAERAAHTMRVPAFHEQVLKGGHSR